MQNKRDKDAFGLMREVRTLWSINPNTRIQENELKNKKKRRQNGKKLINEDYSDL